MQPNANLTLLHLAMLTATMLAIFGWGVICLESELARAAAPSRVASAN